ISPRGEILSLNPAAERLFGYRADEAAGRPVTLLMAEAAPQDRPNPLRDSLPSGSILGLSAGAREVIGKRKSGETFPLELTGNTMLLGEDAVSVAFVRDVSKRKRAQRYLIAHYAATCVLAEAGSLADAVPRILQAVCEALQWEVGTFWRVDEGSGLAHCTEVYQSPAAGLPPGPDARGQTCRPGRGLPGRVWATGEPGWVEDALGAKEYSTHDAAGLRGAFGFPVRVGSAVGGVLTFYCRRRQKRDGQLLDVMTELGKQLGHFVARKQQEEELREITQTIQALVHAAPVAIHTTDLEGKVRLWNPAAERLFGWSAAELLGRPLPPLADAPAGTDTTLPPGGSIQGMPTKCRKKDGGLIDVSLSTAALRGASGEVFGSLGIGMDLTEQRSLEHQLRQAQKMEAVGQLAGGVAHDFNNLLTVITGYCGIVRDGFGDRHPAAEHLDEIQRAGERAAGLTRQLLAFSRKQLLQARVLDLNDALTDVQRMLARLIGEDIHLFTSLAPDLGRVKVDPGQIEQVLVNLAVNARDAMPTGGRLTIETSEVWVGDGGHPASADLPPGRYARLAVTDTGCGMDARTLARVFEPFFTTKEVGKGTGLGLATVYGIVKQSDGHVRATSAVGRGATFEIFLPVVADAPPAEPAARPPAPGGHETVLLAEDEDAVRALARHVLQSKGYTVLEATDGEDAIRVMERAATPVDVLLTDVVMPRLGGRALAEAVSSRHPNVGVLYISGYTDDAVLRNGVMRSESTLLQKPFCPDDLLYKIRDVLDRTGHAHAAGA
ncbi:PAS domain S-box protein, partial [bacterium]|nr:PAS domain S-box protein [bacterium]